MTKTYDDNYLLETYKQKAEKLGRAPTSKELDNDPLLPYYSTYYKRLGTREEICRKLGISCISKAKINALCGHCPREPEICGEKQSECAEKAHSFYG